ncbi:MAG TPA: uracil-DNA glycosylase [Pyrinomonadaceae bacterium]|nr:uracil-DNA glycosylase [Pyrinomonadaceae bacterium]
MSLESSAEEYLSILQDTREQIVYLNELGVEHLETSNIPGDPKERKTAKIPPRIFDSQTTRPLDVVNRVEKTERPIESAASSLLFADIAPPPPTLEKSSETFEQIRADIGDCTRCPLYEKRTNIVHTEGNQKARLMFVGEAPGADEDIQARPFVGRAGQLLTKIIEAIGFKREEVLIGNVNRCRPPGNRPPTEQEASTCKPFLLREIAAVQPDVIVVLGNTATRNLLETKIGITRLRGEFQDYQGVKVMPTFHPAYLLRDPSKKQETWQDLKKVRDYLEVTRKRAT